MANMILWLLIIPLVILVRNEWVYKKRMELNRFEDGVHIIKQYMGYDDMMYRFWVWDIEKLRKPNRN